MCLGLQFTDSSVWCPPKKRAQLPVWEGMPMISSRDIDCEGWWPVAGGGGGRGDIFIHFIKVIGSTCM